MTPGLPPSIIHLINDASKKSAGSDSEDIKVIEKRFFLGIVLPTLLLFGLCFIVGIVVILKIIGVIK